MPRQDHGPQIKNDNQYEKLRRKGMSKEKAARISNAAANSSKSEVGRRGGKSPPYEDWKVGDLHTRAKEIGIEKQSKMTKSDLIKAIRRH